MMMMNRPEYNADGGGTRDPTRMPPQSAAQHPAAFLLQPAHSDVSQPLSSHMQACGHTSAGVSSLLMRLFGIPQRRPPRRRAHYYVPQPPPDAPVDREDQAPHASKSEYDHLLLGVKHETTLPSLMELFNVIKYLRDFSWAKYLAKEISNIPPVADQAANRSGTRYIYSEDKDTERIKQALSSNDKFLTVALVRMCEQFLGREVPKSTSQRAAAQSTGDRGPPQASTKPPQDIMHIIISEQAKNKTFSSSFTSKSMNLTFLICRFMACNDYGSVLLNSELKELLKRDPVASQEEQVSISEFSRFLLVLTKAIILYRYTHAEFRRPDDFQSDVSGAYNERVHQGVMLIWDTVLGNLQMLSRVLCYASTKNWIKLDDYPESLEEYMKKSAEEIVSLRANIDRTDKALLAEHGKILEENEKLNDVRSGYEPIQRKYHELLGQLDLYKRMEQQYSSVPFLLKQLYDADSVKLIVKAGSQTEPARA